MDSRHLRRNCDSIAHDFLVVQMATPIVCQAKAEAMGLEWEWSLTAGCYVNTPELGWWNLYEYENSLDLR